MDLQERTWSNHVYVYSDLRSGVQDLQERVLFQERRGPIMCTRSLQERMVDLHLTLEA